MSQDIKVIYGMVKDPAVWCDTFTCYKANGEDTANCMNCGKNVKYHGGKDVMDRKLIGIICSVDCLSKVKDGYFSQKIAPRPIPMSATENDNDEIETVDNLIKTNSDVVKSAAEKIVITNDKSDKKSNDTLECCPVCGGKRKGRGYSHIESCSAATSSTKIEKKVCSQCGGAAKRGRGSAGKFVHKPDCSNR